MYQTIILSCLVLFIIIKGIFDIRTIIKLKRDKAPEDLWHRVSEGKLPGRSTRYASKHGVSILVFDQDEYIDSGSYVPNICTYNFEDQTFNAMCTNGSFIPVSITHWCELPAKPVINGQVVLEYIHSLSQRSPVMRNIETSIAGDILTIKVDLSKPTELSTSGKSNVIASTEGNVSLPGKEEVKLGINIYTKKT